MPPKQSSIRRSARNEKATAGKDAETVTETKQQSLEDTGIETGKKDGDDNDKVETGTKRDRPVDLTDDGDSSKKATENDQTEQDGDAEEKKRLAEGVTQQDVNRPATNKRQRTEAAEKQGLDGEEGLEKNSEDAKAKGRELKEDKDVDTISPKRGTLERGQIYFIYKPKVETDDPESIDDVARFNMLLLPEAGKGGKDKVSKYRMLIFGRKHAPASRDDGNHEVEWGMISAVGDDLSELKDSLGASTYETKTRGTRHQPASRVAAAGHYILHSPTFGEGIKPIENMSDQDHPRDFPCYLAYSISVPTQAEWGEVQTELCIKPTGSFIVQVKNPDTASSNPRAASSSKREKKEYPKSLRALFTTRFIPANPIELLNYPGQETLFISGRDSLPDSAEKEEVVKPAEKDEKEFEKIEKKDGADEAVFKEVFEELHLYKGSQDVPGIKALEGEWA